MATTGVMAGDLRRALTEVANLVDQGVVLSDGKDVIWANDAACRLLGRDADDLTARSHEELWALVAPEDRARLVKLNRDRRAGRPVPNDYEATFLRGDGDRVVLAVGVRPIDDVGPARLAVSLRDVTARRRAERSAEDRRRMLDRRGREMAGILKAASHDLREPLRMVHSHLQVLERRLDGVLDDDVHAEATEDFALALEGARRMQAYLDDIAAFAQAEEAAPTRRPTDLDDCLDAALDALEARIAGTGADVTRDPLPRLEVDGAEVAELVFRLVDNALTYAGDAPPRVHVGAQEGASGWVLFVRDEGIGIPDDKQDLVLQPFQRLHTWNDVPGTGLGLAICERIARRHGGRLWIESAEGAGTTVFVTLGPDDPADPGDAAAATA